MEHDTPITFHTVRPGAATPADLDTIAIATLAAVAAIVILLATRAWRRRTPGAATCHWQKIHAPKTQTLTAWRRTTCGTDAYTSRARRPSGCKRTLRPRPL